MKFRWNREGGCEWSNLQQEKADGTRKQEPVLEKEPGGSLKEVWVWRKWIWSSRVRGLETDTWRRRQGEGMALD